MLISDILYNSAKRNPTGEAVVDGDRHVTYASLLGMSQSLARKLQEQGFSSGDHAAILLPRSLGYIVSYFAVLFCGGVVVPISVELKPPEIFSDMHYCDVSAMVTAGRWSEKLTQALAQSSLSLLKQVILLDSDGDDAPSYSLPNGQFEVNCHTLRPDGAGSFPQVKRREDDLALLLHTSGTTSNPKRVNLSHGNVVANVRSHIASLGLTVEDTVLIALPMHFGYCNTAQMLTHLYLGGKLVLASSRFVPVAFYALVERERVTTFTGVPTMLLMLLQQGPPTNFDILSLRYICFGGGPMPEGKLRQLIETFPHVGFVQTYGLTEASPRVTALPAEDTLRKLGSIGKPIPGVQVSLLNEHGEPVGPGEVGEIVVNGPNVMLGYYKRPEETQQVLRPEGLFTGDLAQTDGEGYLYIVGRRKNMIICGGINVYPEEIEEQLLNHPAVREVLVVGELHEMLGEIPVALVVLNPRTSITEDELLRYCAERMANYKLPRRIEFREQLAKTYNAKMRRFGQSRVGLTQRE